MSNDTISAQKKTAARVIIPKQVVLIMPLLNFF